MLLVTCHRAAESFDPSPMKNPGRPVNNRAVAVEQELSTARPKTAPVPPPLGRERVVPPDESGFAKDLLNEARLRQLVPTEEGRKWSEFVGVAWAVRQEKWKAQIVAGGRTKALGYFATEEDAARAYDAAAALASKPLNFPGPGQKQAVKRARKRQLKELTFVEKGRSDFVGVQYVRSKQLWAAYIYDEGGRRRSLGYDVDEFAAARLHDEAAAALGKPVNFPTREGQAQAVKRAPNGSPTWARKKKQKQQPSKSQD